MDRTAVADGELQFEIDTIRLARYFRVRISPFILLLILMVFPFISIYFDYKGWTVVLATSPLWIAWAVFFAYNFYFAKKQALALKYWLDQTTLRIDEGILTLKRKSIPLDRITDVMLVQGIGMRLCGIWSLQVQTAGSSDKLPEGTLQGIVEPETIRDKIMEARDRAVGTAGWPGLDGHRPQVGPEAPVSDAP